MDVQQELFQAFAFYASILAVKMMVMSPLTARARFAKQVFANTEDAKGLGGKVKFDDQDVERVRRCHQNDIENIVPFFILGLLYVTTGPAYGFALNLFRTFTAARIAHTFVYLGQVPQPARGIAFTVNILINTYFAYCIITSYW